MTEFLFSLSLVLVIYIYLGYPSIIALLSFVVKRQVKKQANNISISIIISAFNEEKYIAKTIENKLQQNFPQADLEIIVVSDGSTDRTDEIVQSFSDPRITFIRQSPRQGKTAALNRAVESAKGDIIVFSDANSMYHGDALRHLAETFADPATGYVTGKMIYTNTDGSPIGDGCDSYMRYENWIRHYESRVNSIVGVDGGIDAMRREIYQPLSPDQLPDFVQPLYVIKKGYRVVYEPNAILHEESLTEQGSEYRMRVRVSLRALWALVDMRALLNPLNFPVFSWQLLSHKVLRYLTWIPIIVLLILNPLLIGEGSQYKLLMLSQIIFYCCAAVGYYKRSVKDLSMVFTAPYYFLLINIAAAESFLQFIRGKKQVMWIPRAG